MIDQAITHLIKNNVASELAVFFDTLPKSLYSMLDEAQDRYAHLIGITSGNFDGATVEADRVKFALYYERSVAEELPRFIDGDCITVMSDLYNLPKLLCSMQITNDFNWTASSGFTQYPTADSLASCEELRHQFDDDELIAETIEYLIGKGIDTQLLDSTST